MDAQSPITHSSCRPARGDVYILLMCCIHISTKSGPWPTTLRLSLWPNNHISPSAYTNLAHQPITHIYNSFHTSDLQRARPWGHYNSPPLIYALSSVQLSHNINKISKIFKNMWVLCLYSILMLPCHVLRNVLGPLDPYNLNSSIPELFYFLSNMRT